MEIEKVEYRVVQRENNLFVVERKIRDGHWARARHAEEFEAAAGAIQVFRDKVKAQEDLWASMTVKRVVMTEQMLTSASEGE